MKSRPVLNTIIYMASEFSINSPFRYAGGKFYARNLILEHLPPHQNYIEPFAGGASIFFVKSKVQSSWINDIDEELINCYLTIRDQPHELIESLKEESATKERHTFYKKEFVAKNALQRAQRWFYLNRTSYSGIMNMQNCFWGYGEKYSMRPENWPRNILRTSQKLQGVKITNWDFERVLREAPRDAFLFIDPPYFNADQDKFYTHSFERADHYRLSRVLHEVAPEIKFLMTYDNCEEVRLLYNWEREIHEKEWNYTISRTDDQKNKANTRKGSRSKGRELFIVNYYSSAPPVVQPQLFSLLEAEAL